MFKAVKPHIIYIYYPKKRFENQKKFATYLSVQFLAVSPSRRASPKKSKGLAELPTLLA
jgi:Flp pilus assembly CpaE family ATPase